MSLPYPNRIIQQGEPDKVLVTAIQNRLNELGCGPLQAIGIFGPKTTQAVRLLQARSIDQKGNPLKIDGKIGAITWQVLFGVSNQAVVQISNLATQALTVANSQVGVMENPIGSNSGPEVRKYQIAAGADDHTFWCMSFVYWCFQEAANSLSIPNPLVRTASVLDQWNRFAGKKITTDQAVNNPSLVTPGSIFILSTGGTNGHTGIVESCAGGYITTIEGNSNDGGSRNGIGVFKRTNRKLSSVNRGFIVV